MVIDASSIDIREIKEISEMRAVEDLQQEIWGCADREIFPTIALIPMREIGGVMLGAFAEDKMVGFVLGFPGIEDGRLILHSDMLAVKPEYRSRGLGYKLKLAQRERALAKGIDTITWTFDPLQAGNAHFNFAKLGVTADRHLVNFYGETSSFLHRTGTDRLWVTWLLESVRVKERLVRGSVSREFSPDLADIPRLVRVSESNEPIVVDNPRAGRLVIEVPGELDSLVRNDLGLALRWREATRRAFTEATRSGYTVTEFYLTKRQRRMIGSYLVERFQPSSLAQA